MPERAHPEADFVEDGDHTTHMGNREYGVEQFALLAVMVACRGDDSILNGDDTRVQR